MNPARGECEVTLCGRTYTLRPSFSAMSEFDAKTGCTAYEAVVDLTKHSRAPVNRIAAAFWSGIRGAAAPDTSACPTYEQVGAMVMATGQQNVLTAYIQFLTNSLASEQELIAAAKRVASKDKYGGEPGEVQKGTTQS